MTENNETGEELSLQRKQVEALHQIVDLTSSTALSIGNAIGKITRASHLVCHAERITIYLVDEVNRALVPCGPVNNNGSRVSLSLRDGIAGHVATTGQPANVPDTTKDWRFDSRADRASGFNTRSILAVPIKDHLGKTVAVMEACNRQQMRAPARGRTTAVDVVPFSDDDVKMLISLVFLHILLVCVCVCVIVNNNMLGNQRQ
jgi:GAF domain-containing protein